MSIVWMIIIGLIAGAIARLLVPGKENFGWIGTIVLGVVGGFVGGTLGSLVFAPHKLSFRQPVEHTFSRQGVALGRWPPSSDART